jgi:vacuolar-type H+-ATPase subunit I/STV1
MILIGLIFMSIGFALPVFTRWLNRAPLDLSSPPDWFAYYAGAAFLCLGTVLFVLGAVDILRPLP